MFNRIKTAFSKLIFCWKISADISSFFKLILFTKKFKWNRNKLKIKSQQPVKYRLRIGNNSRDIYFRTYAGDLEIFYEIFWKKIYSFEITEPASVLDLGGHIGLASIFFLSKFHSSKIIAIEPDPENFEILKMNLSGEIESGRVKAVSAAINDTDGIIGWETSTLKYNSKISSNDDLKVRSVTMETMIKEYSISNIDLIKIDIESAEEKIFSGGDRSWLKNVHEIIIETHSKQVEELHEKVLNENGFGLKGKRDSAIFFWSNLSGSGT